VVVGAGMATVSALGRDILVAPPVTSRPVANPRLSYSTWRVRVSPATDPLWYGDRAAQDEGERRDAELTLTASLRLTGEHGVAPPRAIGSGCRLLARFGSDDLAPMMGVQIVCDSPSRLRSGEAADVRLSLCADEDFSAPPGTAVRLYQGVCLVGRDTIS
jgi:hypothetical protein